jgi:hypothetical protein
LRASYCENHHVLKTGFEVLTDDLLGVLNIASERSLEVHGLIAIYNALLFLKSKKKALEQRPG